MLGSEGSMYCNRLLLFWREVKILSVVVAWFLSIENDGLCQGSW